MNEDEIIVSNVDYLVTETTVKKTVSPKELADMLKDKKSTASISMRLLQGGMASITVTEKTRLTEKQRDQIRSILGME